MMQLTNLPDPLIKEIISYIHSEEEATIIKLSEVNRSFRDHPQIRTERNHAATRLRAHRALSEVVREVVIHGRYPSELRNLFAHYMRPIHWLPSLDLGARGGRDYIHFIQPAVMISPVMQFLAAQRPGIALRIQGQDLCQEFGVLAIHQCTLDRTYWVEAIQGAISTEWREFQNLPDAGNSWANILNRVEQLLSGSHPFFRIR